MELSFEKEIKCTRCNSKFLNIIGADTFFKQDKEIGKKIIYKCCECNHIFGYYWFKVNNTIFIFEVSALQ